PARRLPWRRRVSAAHVQAPASSELDVPPPHPFELCDNGEPGRSVLASNVLSLNGRLMTWQHASRTSWCTYNPSGGAGPGTTTNRRTQGSPYVPRRRRGLRRRRSQPPERCRRSWRGRPAPVPPCPEEVRCSWARTKPPPLERP